MITNTFGKSLENRETLQLQSLLRKPSEDCSLQTGPNLTVGSVLTSVSHRDSTHDTKSQKKTGGQVRSIFSCGLFWTSEVRQKGRRTGSIRQIERMILRNHNHMSQSQIKIGINNHNKELAKST